MLDGGAWRARNDFALRWTPSEDVGSPIVGATYRICPATNALSDTSGCVTGERRGAGLDPIRGITVPGTGAWRLQLGLEDAMGHIDLDSGAINEDLRLDLDAPRLAFLPVIQRIRPASN